MPVGAHAAEEHTLTLTAASSASVDLVLDAPATAQLFPGSDLGATIGGTFAGFAIQSLPSEQVLIGALRVPAIEGTGESPVDWRFEPRYPPVPMPMTNRRYQEVAQMQPGLYRFTLFADGPTSLQVPISNLSSSIEVAPTDPVEVEFDLFDLDPAPGAYGAPVGVGERTLTLAPSTLTVVAAAAAAQAGQVSFAASCVRASIGPCETSGFLFASPGSVHTRIIDDHQYMPGAIGVAEAYSGFRTFTPGGPTTMRRAFTFRWDTSS